MWEENGWDYGPGDMNDGDPSAGDFTVPTEENINDYYGMAFGPQQEPNTGWEFGPGNIEQWANIGGTPVFGDGQYGGGYMQNGAFQDYSELPNYQSPSQQNLGSIQQTLSGLFNSALGNKGLMTGLGALLEGSQNKKKSAAYAQLAQKMQPAMDPFGSQRGFYQQQLQQAVQDPYSAPIVRDQVTQLQKAQAIKDAAAGRRSNQATSNPALLAAQAQVAQQYMNSLQTPAGAGISPSGLSSLLQTQQQGINSGIQGYASPAMSALGYNSGSNNNSAQLQAILEALAKYKSGS